MDEIKAKTLLIDIETSHLKADFGTLLVFGYKFLDEKKIHVPAITDYISFQKDPTNDKALVKEAHRVISLADHVVGYFSSGFDIKFLNAKMLEWDLPVLTPFAHTDLFYTVKANLALSRKSLANVAYYLRLKAEKTPVEGRIWKRAMAGHQPSVAWIKRHCYADIQLLEEAYLKLRPLIKLHPRLAVVNRSNAAVCRTCSGSGSMQRRGLRITSLGVLKRQYWCRACGSWTLINETTIDLQSKAS